MDIASLISFGILVLAWMVLPVKETEAQSLDVEIEKLVSSRQPATTGGR